MLMDLDIMTARVLCQFHHTAIAAAAVAAAVAARCENAAV